MHDAFPRLTGDQPAPTYAAPRPSIFEATKVFTEYAVTLDCREVILGGIPSNPKIVESWIRAKIGLDDADELRQAMVRSLQERGVEMGSDVSTDELIKASEKLAAMNVNGFKRDDMGLYLESRQLKAALKESISILYAGERWLKTKKGPKNVAAERLFPQPHRIHLLRRHLDGSVHPITEADDRRLVIGHVSGPTGPKSTLTYHEQIDQPTLQFSVLVTLDSLTPTQWAEIWTQAQENGLGAVRSQELGQFSVVRWECVAQGPRRVADVEAGVATETPEERAQADALNAEVGAPLAPPRLAEVAGANGKG